MSADHDDNAPLRVGRRDPLCLALEWPDGLATSLSTASVRRACPCARCVNELTGAPLLDPATVADDLRHEHVELIGRYALGIRFSDGHSTGIFTWPHLRRLAESQARG